MGRVEGSVVEGSVGREVEVEVEGGGLFMKKVVEKGDVGMRSGANDVKVVVRVNFKKITNGRGGRPIANADKNDGRGRNKVVGLVASSEFATNDTN